MTATSAGRDGQAAVHWRFGGWNDARLPRRSDADGWLCPEERDRLGGFRAEKRREDWLVGRVNAKALVADVLESRYGVLVAPASILIDRRPWGAPLVRLSADAVVRGLPAVPPVCLSNSHSAGHALCGLIWTDETEATPPLSALGVDLEWVEPRSAAFVNDFLTPPERAWWQAGDEHERAVRGNAVWSAKEAVLKVVQRGLTVDTYWVTLVAAPDSAHDWLAARLAPADGDWRRLDVTCDPRFPSHGLTFRVVWREIAGFVATIAVGVAAGPGG